MPQKAPGKSHRKGITLAQLIRTYPDNASAEKAFVARRWPNGIACPHCGDTDIQERTTHPEMPYRCRGCKKFFSVKTGTVMQGSKIGYQGWLIAMYSMLTNLKGTSSMKLHRDLGITQKSAWHLAHRIREAWADKQAPFAGPVEVDETFVGGRESNKHGSKRIKGASGTVGKVAVAGVKDRATGRVVAQPVARTNKETLQEFVQDNTADGAEIYTDDAKAYDGLPNHATVKHSIRQYVDGKVHTNGIESFWSMFKRGHKGTYHKMSRKHLRRYVNEFAGRHNRRPLDTEDQMGALVCGMDGKRLRYADLIEPNGLDSGARTTQPIKHNPTKLHTLTA